MCNQFHKSAALRTTCLIRAAAARTLEHHGTLVNVYPVVFDASLLSFGSFVYLRRRLWMMRSLGKPGCFIWQSNRGQISQECKTFLRTYSTACSFWVNIILVSNFLLLYIDANKCQSSFRSSWLCLPVNGLERATRQAYFGAYTVGVFVLFLLGRGSAVHGDWFEWR